MGNIKTELLAPAGSYEAFKAGLLAGADAFYLGGTRFGARAYADNFNDDDLLRTIDEAHFFDKRVYLTINTLFKERELQELYDYLLPYYRQGLDAVIIQDMGTLKTVKEVFPDIHIHASTQMTVTGVNGARFLDDIGVKRVVPARELSIREIKEISSNTSLEIECFVHGALCYCYSGQCLMSSFIGGRSGNRGRCAQPCRLPYSVLKDGRQISDDKNAYALNTKDICLIDNVGELIDAGVTSFKIEGRMKRPEYTAGVVSVYRKYIDLYEENQEKIKADSVDRELLSDLFNRDGFSKSYFFQHNGRDMMALKNAKMSEPRIKKAQNAYDFVKDTILNREFKKNVEGRFIIDKDNKTAKFILTDGVTTVWVLSDEVQESLNRPLDKEFVEKQLKKTGGTPFNLEKLEIEITDNAFMTVKQLNELRRSAFDKFRDEVVSSFRRNEITLKPLENRKKETTGSGSEELWVSVLTKEQFDEIKDIKGIDGFYLPIELCLNAFTAEELEKIKEKTYISLPYISRSVKNHSYQNEMIRLVKSGFGMLVRSLEDAAVLIKNDLAEQIRLDYNMYTMNSGSIAFWKTFGVNEYTVPAELNKKEIMNRENSDSDLIIYGRIPLMVSAQCVRKNYGKCDHSYGSMTLKDRKKTEFPVFFECGQCYNVIYNSVPVSLLSVMEQAEKAEAGRYRIILTTENKKECARLVMDAVDIVKRKTRQYTENFEFTRGHFNRGIE